MFKQVKVENLPVYMNKIDRLFPEFSSKNGIGIHNVIDYYRESFWGYAIFHSWAGAIHMALSENGKFSKNDYFRQAEEFATILAEQGGKVLKVLEVGCGRGFNITYLAQRFPNHEFVGADISESNVRSAKKAAAGIRNLSIVTSDFHDLCDFRDGEFDLVLAVETLCHASVVDMALASISRVLSKGGVLVVFDGFRDESAISDNLVIRAVSYTERAMAVPQFLPARIFVDSAKRAGLDIKMEQDRSDEIMPNLIRLSDFAKAFFKISPISRLILHILPRGLVTNAVAGLLMAVTVQTGAHRYLKMALSKR